MKKIYKKQKAKRKKRFYIHLYKHIAKANAIQGEGRRVGPGTPDVLQVLRPKK